MLKLKTALATQKGKLLDHVIEKEILRREGKIAFRGLGKRRPVFLTKYLEANENRIDKNRRKQKFFAGLELLKRAQLEDMTDKIKEPTGELSFEFKGIAPNEELVGVHIREVMERKDKKLYLISTF